MIIKKAINSEEIPEYHEGQLIVKMRTMASPAGIPASDYTAASPLATSGMSALSFFERGGLIKRVIPLSAPAEAEDLPAGAMSFGQNRSALSMLATSASPTANDPNEGVSIIELQRDRDVSDLQIALAQDPNVEFVSRVPVRYLHATSKRGTTNKDTEADKDSAESADSGGGVGIMAIPPPVSTMWNLQKILWQQARALPNFRDANNIKVAVLDTGIEQTHPDLNGRVSRYLFNYTGIPSASGNSDIIGHGTHVAGTIAALFGNNFGINGICNCQLHAYKIFDDTPDFNSRRGEFVYYVDTAMYHRALAECIQQRVDVVNLSIGGGGAPSPQERTLFNTLLANGTTIVASMGNDRQAGSPISYPAAIQGVIAVGATNLDDTVAQFSNRGNHISIAAPGVAIWSTLPTYPGHFGFSAAIGPNGQPIIGAPKRRETAYDAWNGTSMAAPHVAAAVALLLANKGPMSPANVHTRLMQSADPVAGMGGLNHHPDFGAGRLNLLRLLQ
ncbi:protease [Pontibacter diazotrophicus]|uniref:Protease n=1 Tax=Pontibacter diazotrophicus TaxID=1400979 RepID=A0A3D8LHE7_9BACT|nr:S8 family serine peptidase [Pontibacter diazotrophicus]RDV16869.1 protease [Pontibacter diazotrophicus]